MLQFQAGDGSAFDRIVLHYRSMVERFIHRYVGDADRAEDLAQEVFLRVHRARHRYRPEAAFRTWLFTIAVRLCLNELRSRRRERRVIVPMPRGRDGAEEAGGLEETLAAPDQGPPSRALEEEELERAVREALAELPPHQRAALLLLRFEEMSYREIGESMGLSVMAVKSLVHRGREALRLRLGTFLRRA